MRAFGREAKQQLTRNVCRAAPLGGKALNAVKKKVRE
jgi:hypothetical protein